MEEPQLTCIKTPFNQTVIDRCPSLKRFKPLLGARSGDAQTFLRHLLPVQKNRYAREMLVLPDGVETYLDWKYSNPARIREDPIVLCLAAMGGDSNRSNHMNMFTNYCQSEGYTTVVFNRRGHGEASLLPKIGRVSDAACVFPRHVNLPDLVRAVEHICLKYPNNEKHLVGFSSGGNLAINYLAYKGDACPFLSAAVVCHCYDLRFSGLSESWSFRDVTVNALKKLLKRRLPECQQIAKEKNVVVDWKAAKRASTVLEFDRCLAAAYGCGSVEELYAEDSSHDKLGSVKVPLLCVQNHTDPLVPPSMNLHPSVNAMCNPKIVYVETQAGGHLGFVESFWGIPWHAKLLVEYMKCCSKRKK
jgi:predicted alpha/beta-fold hydrolase